MKLFKIALLLSIIAHISSLYASNIPSQNVLGSTSNISPSEIISISNAKRIEAGLNTLTPNEKLTRAAQAKAIDMINNNYWKHYSSEGTAPWDFILATDYQYQFAGENLARNFNSSKDVVAAWMKSPPHKDNLLLKQYQDIGVSVVENINLPETKTIIVMLLANQADKTINSQYRTTHVLAPQIAIRNKLLLALLITATWISLYRLINKQYDK